MLPHSVVSKFCFFECLLYGEHIQSQVDVEYREDGTVWVYYRDQALEITNLFDENGVCFVKLEDGSNTLYLTVRYGNGYSYSSSRYE